MDIFMATPRILPLWGTEAMIRKKTSWLRKRSLQSSWGDKWYIHNRVRQLWQRGLLEKEKVENKSIADMVWTVTAKSSAGESDQPNPAHTQSLELGEPPRWLGCLRWREYLGVQHLGCSCYGVPYKTFIMQCGEAFTDSPVWPAVQGKTPANFSRHQALMEKGKLWSNGHGIRWSSIKAEHFFFHFEKYSFKIVLDLQKNCKDSTENSLISHTVTAYTKVVLLSQLMLSRVSYFIRFPLFLADALFLFQVSVQDPTLRWVVTPP